MLTEQKMDDLIGMVKGFAPGIATAIEWKQNGGR